LRGRHGATPTAVGRSLIDGAEVALAAIARAEQDALDAAAGRAGRLRVGVTPTLGAVLLPSVLASFRHTHPDVRLDLVSSGDSAWLRQQAGAGQLDIAVAALAANTESNSTVALTGEQRFVLIAPSDLRLGTAVHRRALIGVPVVALTAGEGLRQQLDQVFAELGVEPNIAIETSEREMLVPFVAAGLGVALVPEGFARARPAKGLTIHELDPPLRRRIGAVTANEAVSVLTHAFLDALVAGTDLVRVPRARRRRTPGPGR
jgi:DNA-binding transcriptional LysR family regulator